MEDALVGLVGAVLGAAIGALGAWLVARWQFREQQNSARRSAREQQAAAEQARRAEAWLRVQIEEYQELKRSVDLIDRELTEIGHAARHIDTNIYGIEDVQRRVKTVRETTRSLKRVVGPEMVDAMLEATDLWRRFAEHPYNAELGERASTRCSVAAWNMTQLVDRKAAALGRPSSQDATD